MESTFQHNVFWFIVQSSNLILVKNDYTLPCEKLSASLQPYFLRHLSLGCFNHINYYCAEVSAETVISDALQAFPLRQALSVCDESMLDLAIKAYSVINWDRNHQFCSRCGSSTVHQSKTFERSCLSCGLSFFPRISPSIIVRITRGDQILMARSPHFAPGVYGLIAGYVDVGESVEAAVHREVMEEVGLKIKNLVYFGSQPWPFPDSLMLAFTADYDSGEIIMDPYEIEDAGWYSADNLPGLPSTSRSIAMRLIDDFFKTV